MQAKRFTLQPEARLRRRAEISRCRDEGTKLYSKHFLMLVAPGASEESRLAIAVTTKIEKRAVIRNRIKRRLRELFRTHRHLFKRPVDILIVARRDIQACAYEDYEREVLGALRSKGYLVPG